ncbi:MAG TPA: NfuA family Fe-S biogenesis protein [Xanthomonadales bacterium]|nr:NfuA family Fe-S biogenesis protein [Xanthomonadales bacterium]
MIQISETAQTYFKHLIEQQDDDDLGLRISVSSPGTPNASCDLQFCPHGTEGTRDHKIPLNGFDFFIDRQSVSWLSDAEIDFEEEATGGQLTIRAPGIKGSAPEDDASLDERVQWTLDSEINPMLASHGGQVALVEITSDLKVVLQFGGGCQGCGMADVTLKQGISTTLHERFSEITDVVDVTDHESGENPYYQSGAPGTSPV